MASMGTADALLSFGMEPVVVLVPRTFGDAPIQTDVEVLERQARTLRRSALVASGWMYHAPTDIRVEVPIRRGYSYSSISVLSGGDYLDVAIVDVLNVGTETSPRIMGEILTRMMSVARTAETIAGNDMLPSIPIVDLVPGTPVRITAKPIGVTLVRPTGVIVGPSKWEGYYLVRLDEPAIYHRGDGTDEPLAEIVEAPDNFAVLSQVN